MPSHGPTGDPHGLADHKKKRMREELMHTLARQGHVNVPGASPVSPGKAREMLRHGKVHGKKLTSKQRGLFGLIASGKKPSRVS